MISQFVCDAASIVGRRGLACTACRGSAVVAATNQGTTTYEGSIVAAAQFVDRTTNKDFDDLMTLPRRFYNRVRGPARSRKHVVVLGSGCDALSFARKLDPMDFDITVIAPCNAGLPAGTAHASSVIEVARQSILMPYARYLQAECTGLDVDARLLQCNDSEARLDVFYDHLVIAAGAQPKTFGIPGVQENAMFLKELDDGLALRMRILQQADRANVALMAGHVEEMETLLSVAIVGGGPTGVELAAHVADFIHTDVKRSFPNIADKMKVTLVEALPRLLPMFDKSVGENVEEHLRDAGVNVFTKTMVKNVESHVISLGSTSGKESKMDYGVLVWVAGIGARPIVKTLAAAFGQSNPRGIEVDDKLRVKGRSTNDVFALGDCAVGANPFTGQAAAQQGKYLGCAFHAQVAVQQGKYLGRAFRDEGASASAPFREAMAELATPTLGVSKLSDSTFWRNLSSCPQGWLRADHRSTLSIQTKKEKLKFTVVDVGFASQWGVFFKKSSYSMRFNVGTDWIRNIFLGRQVAASSAGPSH